MNYIFSRWDGTQAVPDLSDDEIFESFCDDFILEDNAWPGVHRVLTRGVVLPDGRVVRGLVSLVQRIREERRAQFRRNNSLSSDDVAAALEYIVRLEHRHTTLLQSRPKGLRGPVPGSGARFDDEHGNMGTLSGGLVVRMEELQRHHFIHREAQLLYEDVLGWLRRRFMLGSLVSVDLDELNDMLRDVHRVLRRRVHNEAAQFPEFISKWNKYFPGVVTLDDFTQHFRGQLSTRAAFMASLSAQEKAVIDGAISSVFLRDELLERLMAAIAADITNDRVATRDRLLRVPTESARNDSAIKDRLARLNNLERDIQKASSIEELNRIDVVEIETLLGRQAAHDFSLLIDLLRRLIEGGYFRAEHFQLRPTPQALRRLGLKILTEVFKRLRNKRGGEHDRREIGGAGDRAEGSRSYEFGLVFDLDISGTVLAAVAREGARVPARLSAKDFRVFNPKISSRVATVLMLDMSRSMLNNGFAVYSKKIVLALATLLKEKFPSDRLYFVGFSLMAREFGFYDLVTSPLPEWNIGSNMQAAFDLSRQLLRRHPGSDKQIVIVTDGEATAYTQEGIPEFSYPPTQHTIDQTFREVQRCTRENISINVFMLERSPWLTRFADELTRINHGRLFFPPENQLIDDMLIEFLTNRRRPR